MKVAVLWTKLSGYLNSCLHALAQIPDVELLVSYEAPAADAPFRADQFRWLTNVYSYQGSPRESGLLPLLRSFNPDLLVVASWHLPAYRAACRELQGRAVRVCCMDNQWEGTLKQWIGAATAPWFVQRLFDVAFVAGERQSVFAGKLGFSQDRIWRGLYACDLNRFAASYEYRRARNGQSSGSFLCVGRLSPEKGFDTLLAAYKLYREQQTNPWPLLVAGEGPLRKQLEGVPGVKLLGFIQPDELPDIFSRAGCFVLPSHWEPWGVAIHEAAASGLPIICTSSCGAAVHLVQDGDNGYLTESGNVQGLARAMRRFTNLDEPERKAMGEASHLLSLQFSPERWARYLHERSLEIIPELAGRRSN
jgi:glycosyltransferase involved in cell wall biosynthesis